MPERSLFSSLLKPDRFQSTARDIFSCLPTLETKRLILRTLRMKDADDIYAYSADPEVARFVLWDAHKSISDSKAYLRYIIRQYHDGAPSSYGIVLKETGHVIGTIGFMAYDAENALAEVGYSLGRAHWNRGYMSEALNAFLELCFTEMQLHRVEGVFDVANPASGHVMEKCGMIREGVFRKRIWNKGQFVDAAVCAILAEDWQQR